MMQKWAKALVVISKYYITTQHGGYSRCIEGYPAGNKLNVLPNCVGYACGRFNEIYSLNTGYLGMKYPRLNVTAKKFIEKCKKVYPELEIGMVPKKGAIIVFRKPDEYGHVAIVEELTKEFIFISESFFGGPAYNERKIKVNELSRRDVLGYIYNPSVE